MPSARFLANLTGFATPRWTTVVEWSNDGGNTWVEATFAGGTVTASSTSQVRWQSSIALLDVPYGAGGINPYQTRYRIRHGMVFSDHERPEFVGLGYYRVKTAQRSSATPNRIEITGESYESYLIQANLVKPRTIFPAPAREVLDGLIREVLPAARIYWHEDIDADALLPKLVSVSDRWATIDGGKDATSIARALSARVYQDGDGGWRVDPVPTLQDPISFEAFEGPGGISLGVSEELSNEGVTNVEIVTGTPTGSSVVIGPGIAQDLDPLSYTFVGRSPDEGGYGVVPADEYQTQLATSLSKCVKIAQSRLAARLGLRQQLSGAFLHDPTKLPGDVGLIHGLDVPMLAILDSVTYDLSGAPGPLQCQCRTTQTRLAGVISEAVSN